MMYFLPVDSGFCGVKIKLYRYIGRSHDYIQQPAYHYITTWLLIHSDLLHYNRDIA